MLWICKVYLRRISYTTNILQKSQYIYIYGISNIFALESSPHTCCPETELDFGPCKQTISADGWCYQILCDWDWDQSRLDDAGLLKQAFHLNVQVLVENIEIFAMTLISNESQTCNSILTRSKKTRRKSLLNTELSSPGKFQKWVVLTYQHISCPVLVLIVFVLQTHFG